MGEASNLKVKEELKEREQEIQEVIQENVRNAVELQDAKAKLIKQEPKSNLCVNIIDLSDAEDEEISNKVIQGEQDEVQELKRENVKLIQKISFIQEQNMKKDEEFERMKQQLQMLDMNIKPKWMDSFNKCDEKEKNELKKQLKNLRVQLDERDLEITDLQEYIEKINVEKNEIAIKLKNCLLQKTEDSEHSDDSSSNPFDQRPQDREIGLLKQEYRKSQADFGNCILEKTKLEREVIELQRKSKKYEKAVEDHEKLGLKYQELKEDHSELIERKNKLQDKLGDVESKCRDLKKDNERLSERRSKLVEKLRKAEADADNYQTLMEKSQKIVKSVANEVEPMQKEIKEKEKEIKKLMDANEELSQLNKELNKENEAKKK